MHDEDYFIWCSEKKFTRNRIQWINCINSTHDNRNMTKMSQLFSFLIDPFCQRGKSYSKRENPYFFFWKWMKEFCFFFVVVELNWKLNFRFYFLFCLNFCIFVCFQNAFFYNKKNAYFFLIFRYLIFTGLKMFFFFNFYLYTTLI